MARDWIEFVQTQHVPWVADDLWGLRPGVETKVLSRDVATGACSLLVRYPPGFRAGGGVLNADEEFLVVAGGLDIGDLHHGDLAYAHLPAGYPAGDLFSEHGATVLTFFSGTPARSTEPAAYDEALLVEHLDGFAVPYTGNFSPEFPPGAGRKVLFTNPYNGETTWILGTIPMRWAERSETHPNIEGDVPPHRRGPRQPRGDAPGRLFLAAWRHRARSLRQPDGGALLLPQQGRRLDYRVQAARRAVPLVAGARPGPAGRAHPLWRRNGLHAQPGLKRAIRASSKATSRP